jgi:hypothetical protein
MLETIVWFWLEDRPEFNRTERVTARNMTELFDKILKLRGANQLYRFYFVKNVG